MEALNPTTPMQLLLTILLFGLLVSWMVTFLVLAIRPETIKRPTISIQESKDEHASTLAPEAIATPPEPAPAMMHMVTVPPTRSHS